MHQSSYCTTMLATRVIANTDGLREIAPRVAGKLVANCDRPQYRDRSISSTEAFRTEKQLKKETRPRPRRFRHLGEACQNLDTKKGTLRSQV